MGKNDNPSFADLIEDAQRTPRPREGAGDLSSVFGRPIPGDHRVVDDDPGRVPGGVEYDYDNHIGYFEIPTNAEEYTTILNRVARGEAIIRYEERTFTKDGDFLVVVCYMTRRPRPGRNVRRDRRDGDDDREPLDHD